MPKLIFLTLSLTFALHCSFAQTAAVSGTVTDTVNQKKLQYAVISLLQKSDSSLYSFWNHSFC